MCRKFILGLRLIYQNCLFLSFSIRNVILHYCYSLLTFEDSLFSIFFVKLRRERVEEVWRVLEELRVVVVMVEEGQVVKVQFVSKVLKLQFIIFCHLLAFVVWFLFDQTDLSDVVAEELALLKISLASVLQLVAQIMIRHHQYSNQKIMMIFHLF